MPIIYRPAPEVAAIAEKLIEQYHQHIKDFNVRVEYVFQDKIQMKGDNEVWGTCRKITNLNAYLASNEQSSGDPFFVISIAEPVWEILPEKERMALVDHELCHTAAEYQEKDDEEPVVKLAIKPHDMEEFACIVRRHGMWRDSIKEFIDNARADKLLEEEDEEEDDGE